MTETLFYIVVFYTTLITGLVIFGASVGIETGNVPILSYPDFSIGSSIPLIGSTINFVSEFVVYIVQIVAFLFMVMKFTLTDLYPTWINIIIFAPLVFYGGYEVVARIGRGS